MRSHPVLTVSLSTAFLLVGASLLTSASGPGFSTERSHRAERSRSTSSGPIQITPDDEDVWVANPDRNSVTRIDVKHDRNRKRDEVKVGVEPHGIAISPDGERVYVANSVSGTVSVIRAGSDHPKVSKTIHVGTEPYALALTPNGDKLYVANARSNDISVIDTDRLKVVHTLTTEDGVGLEPRALAVTSDGDGSDKDEKLYVTSFLGVDKPGKTIGADDYKEAHVSVFSTRRDRFLHTVVLNPLANVGFNSNGNTLAGIAPGANFDQPTGAFPNQLNSIVIKGDHAYLPNTAASPNGPVRFNVNVQSFLSVIDLATDTEGATINMNKGINLEAASPTRVFLAVPWAAAFAHGSNTGYVVASASNLIVKVDLDANGAPTIHAPATAGDPGAVVRVFVGQNPTGIVINSKDTRAYVTNEVSHDVSVVDLSSHQVMATVASSDLPAPGSDAARLLIGKAVFNSSTGVSLPSLGVNIGARLSNGGWSGCVSCHPFGLTDGVVWMFATGPRRTLQLNGTFNPHDPNDMKMLNHSAIRDEVQDFELNSRAVQGGLGLITLADGTTPDPNVANFTPPSAGRSEPLDDMALWVARGVRTPLSPFAQAREHGDDDDHDDRLVERGRKLFASARCASCHGGPGWSVGRRNFTPPPDPSILKGPQVIGALRSVGTFDPAAANEVRDVLSPAALGADGFVPPSLLGAHAFPPYLHNGSAPTVLAVLDLVPHRSAGTGGVDMLAGAKDREALARFVESIDASTKPFDPTAGSPVAVSAEMQVVKPGALSGPHVSPSPAHHGTTISFTLPAAGNAELAIYDLLGRRIATLADGLQPAGPQNLRWDGRARDGSPAWPGVYFARLVTGGRAMSTRFIVTP
ncbi:MAG TPA: beta-propeller fold lactonase family protein [Verrucomicrobiae bacterium]|nr:beta-propeller fold lactonase family protein [Verrucomicrobiae bacterium]